MLIVNYILIIIYDTLKVGLVGPSGYSFYISRKGGLMIRLSILSVVVLLGLIVSVTAYSQEQDPEHGYIGVYVDYERSVNCYLGGGGGMALVSSWREGNEDGSV